MIVLTSLHTLGSGRSREVQMQAALRCFNPHSHPVPLLTSFPITAAIHDINTASLRCTLVDGAPGPIPISPAKVRANQLSNRGTVRTSARSYWHAERPICGTNESTNILTLSSFVFASAHSMWTLALSTGFLVLQARPSARLAGNLLRAAAESSHERRILLLDPACVPHV